jgi:hypothetical protein
MLGRILLQANDEKGSFYGTGSLTGLQKVAKDS